MPFDPGAKLNLTLKTNKWVFNKAYSRSYYLLINDNNKYQAYILTIIADSDYVKNDLTKLTHNSYRKLDADFSGLVLYYTPKGDYIGGYGYKDGHLVQPETTATQSGSKKTQSVNSGALKPNTMVADCVDWYQQTTVYYEDGHSETFDWVYLDTTCTYRDDGTNTGSTPPAAPPALPPPPPPCPPGTGTGSSPCSPVNVDEVKNNNVPLPPNPGDGGAPPPPAQTPCTVNVKPCPADDPCAKKADVVARATNSIIAAQNTSILTNTIAHGAEYGANQNLASLTGSTYVNTPVTTNGGASTWTIGFSWDSTNGYTVGFSHGHPEGYGPSPADVDALFSPINTQSALRNNATNKQIYEEKASVTTMTSTGSYVVTISNWAALNTLLANSYSDATQQFAFESSYQTILTRYQFDNPGATKGDAGAAALIQLFPGMINVYYAPKGTTSYTPITIGATGAKTITLIQCP